MSKRKVAEYGQLADVKSKSSFIHYTQHVTGPSAIRVSLAVLTWFSGPYLVRWFEIPVLF